LSKLLKMPLIKKNKMRLQLILPQTKLPLALFQKLKLLSL
jgi:hypothetical protein